ncbi:MAG: ATP-binding protein [Verrucomicrobia bacterium]|nr:ATP-binding protein [Verrucomicrobiota bacterium]
MPSNTKQRAPKNAFDKAWTEDLVRAMWLGLGGRTSDLEAYLRRILPKWEVEAPELTKRLQELLVQSQQAGGGTVRRVTSAAEQRANNVSSPVFALTVDNDDLLRFESPVVLPVEPVWSSEIAIELNSIIKERRAGPELAKFGLSPTHTVIFTGLPGVGKTLAARWLARELNLPLAVLNLGTVMSSFLGRTGANLRQVIAYASKQPCVLLLDELDAIAKRRDDNSDIGELKRLVTVLLQELDAWPSEALLIAATNHADLIDPAVWRRFERRVAFPLPQSEQQAELLYRLLGTDWASLSEATRVGVSAAATRLSPADMTQIALRTKREMIVSPGAFEPKLLANFSGAIASLPLVDRRKVGLELKRLKIGQREINRLTGLARETIRSLQTK